MRLHLIAVAAALLGLPLVASATQGPSNDPAPLSLTTPWPSAMAQSTQDQPSATLDATRLENDANPLYLSGFQASSARKTTGTILTSAI